MKKMVFTLALLLMSLSAALAQASTFKITHAVARNSKVNQMYVTTKSGDVKYYNTADLTSVKFEGELLLSQVQRMMSTMLQFKPSDLLRRPIRAKVVILTILQV